MWKICYDPTGHGASASDQSALTSRTRRSRTNSNRPEPVDRTPQRWNANNLPPPSVGHRFGQLNRSQWPLSGPAFAWNFDGFVTLPGVVIFASLNCTHRGKARAWSNSKALQAVKKRSLLLLAPMCCVPVNECKQYTYRDGQRTKIIEIHLPGGECLRREFPTLELFFFIFEQTRSIGHRSVWSRLWRTVHRTHRNEVAFLLWNLCLLHGLLWEFPFTTKVRHGVKGRIWSGQQWKKRQGDRLHDKTKKSVITFGVCIFFAERRVLLGLSMKSKSAFSVFLLSHYQQDRESMDLVLLLFWLWILLLRGSNFYNCFDFWELLILYSSLGWLSISKVFVL